MSKHQLDGYWVALFNEGGETAGVEREVGRYGQIEEAWTSYKRTAVSYPHRIVMICDRATVLARSDRRAPPKVA
jgi:hypothetical protein